MQTLKKVGRKEFIPAFILVFNSLVWYTLTYAMFSNAINELRISATETLLIFTVYYVGITSSGIAGSVVFPRKRDNLLLVWMLAGTIMTVLLTTIENNTTSINTLVSLLLGVSAGIGLPSCLAYYADATLVEERGAHGGVTWSLIGFTILVLALLITGLDSVYAFVTLMMWRLLGLIAFFLTKGKARSESIRNPSTYRAILRRKDVILYLIPWVMFSLVNFTETPILEKLFGEFHLFAGFIEFAITGFVALLSGFLADFAGRKRVIITGFVILGIGYALLSLFSESPLSWYLYTAFDGIAWGMFASVFFMTIWGDLAVGDQKEKYYVLGGLPYFIGGFLPIIIRPYVGMVPIVAAFSLASFFLFLAVLPLIYAPETLPEKSIQRRELQKYAEDAEKLKRRLEGKK